jgi:16S rRNA (guanine1516-N2)-methyltransferase
VVCVDPQALPRAREFCRRQGLPLFEGALPKEVATPLALVFEGETCFLQPTGPDAPGPVRASFIDGAVEHRRRFGGGKGQLIAKAVGLNRNCTPRVLDATAGLGRDAWVLACLGCPVTLLERSPVIALMLESALREARQSEQAEIAHRIALHQVDAHAWLGTQPEASVEVIYLDPMYPHRDKSAAVKKEMAVFQSLLGQDADASGLMELALACARNRVVVKRPRKAETLSAHRPSYQLDGKSCRYDIYALQKLC